jgi:hypothetical protein
VEVFIREKIINILMTKLMNYQILCNKSINEYRILFNFTLILLELISPRHQSTNFLHYIHLLIRELDELVHLRDTFSNNSPLSCPYFYLLSILFYFWGGLDGESLDCCGGLGMIKSAQSHE